MKNFLLGIIFTLIALIALGGYYAYRGYLDMRADQEPSPLESKIAMSAMDASADRHAPDIKNPVPATEDNLAAGAKIFMNHCAGCHGLPSNADTQLGRSFYPPAPQFFKDAPDMPDNENFYVIQHGVRWTGMPAWSNTLSDQEIWQVTGFLSAIGKLPPAAQKELVPAPLPDTTTPAAAPASPRK
jgi:mono/diheme cytochrome c family protein